MLPNVVQVGDTTGGGSGFPLSSELPNGWSVRFSSSPIYGIIEKAREILNKKVAQ